MVTSYSPIAKLLQVLRLIIQLLVLAPTMLRVDKRYIRSDAAFYFFGATGKVAAT